MKLFARIAPLCGALLFIVTPALSAPLAPSGIVFTTGTTFAADPELGGVVRNDSLEDFRLDPTPGTPLTDVGGRVQNRVVESNLLNTMIFMPRIFDTFNIDGGTFGITSFRLDGYAGWDVDVDFRTDGVGDKGFTSVTRFASGDILTFRYDDPLFIDAIAPGAQDTSLFPAIKTNAPNFALTGSMEIFGQLFDSSTGGASPISSQFTVRIDGIAVPVAAVPVPAGGILILSAIAGLFGIRRFEAKASA